jgi:hypothetical protein
MRLCRAVAAQARVGCFLSLIIQTFSDRTMRPDAPAEASGHGAERVRSARAAWPPADRGMARQPGLGSKRQPAGASFGDGFPDQLGDIDDEIRSGLTWIAG